MLFIVRTGSVDPLTAGAGAERRAEARRSAKHGEAQDASRGAQRGVRAGAGVGAGAGAGAGAVAAAACVRAVAWVQRRGVEACAASGVKERGGTVRGAGGAWGGAEEGAGRADGVRRRVWGAPADA